MVEKYAEPTQSTFEKK